MTSVQFDLDAWLERIDYSGALDATEDGLAALHHAQFFSIPFENFDVIQRRGVNLAPDALFDKLVNQRRGGYCFELNGLFLRALQAIGFEARALLARVHVSGEPSGRSHQVSLVTIDGRDWVVDVGFGGANPRRPLPLELERETIVGGCGFRLVDGGDYGFMFQARVKGRWKDMYSFDLGRVFPNDIAYGNFYSSNSPNAVFTRFCVAARPTETGGVTLLNRTLRIATLDDEETLRMPEGSAYFEALEEHFGIAVETDYDSLYPITKKKNGQATVFGF